ncbi:methylenetetrahydrofolate--tRNA-(uracil(54)-C(5))-methyltransferase (FADH(2)-oxidizing) TrmFO [Bartonella harrusi]|uniref:Methylenetetrahydrofolate--tRNA-(uracil-5-)-methyltransferase TrmFO n=1 Tax=Bartonella harrusi TaxID=2961895 RepID=A0ABY5EUK0_9HYPH|nr:methylenetetrahydrofolate--tRNA-(uracil(54)-C(5))-methyltransferase (FADH(2)-oxidizing) TrmFO [Bartonella harrusi]UTO28800.1 methylenetetrahydrofolate--tRNA-(uracil(54)-C(5))-methyltransferase (FADH(2)-oxidizing) TrmFO [Bartonella harrusi]
MLNIFDTPIHIIGGGLAGSEACWQIAQSGIPVILHEMRPHKKSDAHKTDKLAELVCSNSFRSDDSSTNAVGLLHAEMRLAKSLIMKVADANKVPAGSALAVDRDGFSKIVTESLENHPLIKIEREEIQKLPEDWHHIIIATGPLTSPALAQAIRAITGTEALSFFDAIAPIIYTDSIDMDICWHQSRYDKIGPDGTGKDYLNCPLDKEQYNAFVQALKSAEKIEFRDFEKTPYFDGCLPIEVMAERGLETLRHGPMKPMGLTNTHKPTIKPYAVVQLRQDNKLGTLYNMVGFQTKLKYGEQARIFRMIPGLENAEFARLGGLHRNTYLNSPTILDQTLRLKQKPQLRFAGQITGCEGYVESSAIGLLAGRFAAAEYHNNCPCLPPLTTAFGALLNHITGGHIVDMEEKRQSFQPMNINFGLFPPINPRDLSEKRLPSKEKKLVKKQALTARALNDCLQWLTGKKQKSSFL